MEAIEKSIIQTLAYFDIYNFPLTCEEIINYLWQSPHITSHLSFSASLNQLKKKSNIGYAGSYYFLPGRDSIVAERESKIKFLEKKISIAKRACKILRFTPYLRAVFICNTVAAGTANFESDIDVLIITARNRLWISRFLATALLSLFRLRRTNKKIKNKICLSFYLTDTTLNLSSITINQPDIYLAYWLKQLVPLYDPDKLWQSLQKANIWTKPLVSVNENCQILSKYAVADTKMSGFIKKFFALAWRGSYGDMLESQAKKIQLEHMKKFSLSPRSPQTRGVTISDSMLKFHENDRREEYKNLWIENCKRLF